MPLAAVILVIAFCLLYKMPDIERIPLTQLELFEVNNFYETLFISRISHLHPDSAYIEWELNETRVLEDKIPVYEYNIYRSQAESGPWDLLNDAPTTDLFYLDSEINNFSLHRTYYYKIQANSTNLNTPEILESRPTSELSHYRGLQRRRYLEQQKIKRDKRVQLFMVSSERYILKRKHYGERCNVCFDPVSNTSILNKCFTCYGTSFVGGYYNPIRVLVENSQEQVLKEVTEHGYSEIITSNILIQDVPRITRDDLVYDPINNRMWKIIGVTQTLLNKVPSSQTLNLTELSHDSIEYQISIDPNAILNLYQRIIPMVNP